MPLYDLHMLTGVLMPNDIDKRETPTSMRDTILNEMRAVATLHGKRLQELTDDLLLSEFGARFALLCTLGRAPRGHS